MAYTPRTADFLVNANTAGNQNDADVIRLSDGRYLAVWDGPMTASAQHHAVRGQFFAADGTKIGGEMFLSAVIVRSQTDTTGTALPGGGFALAWTQFTSFGSIVEAAFYDAAGTRISQQFTVDVQAASPAIAALPNGNVVIVWTDAPDTTADILGTIMTPAGLRQDFVVDNVSGSDQSPAVRSARGADRRRIPSQRSNRGQPG